MKIRELKSGSDIRGTALGGYGQDVDLTPVVAGKVTSAFIVFLSNKIGKKEGIKVAVGHDSRLSAESLKAAVIDSLKISGVIVYDCGLASTPSMFMMTQFEQTACDGAVMITASHHPKQKNGLKFFTNDGGISSKELDEIIILTEKEEVIFGTKPYINKSDYLGLYSNFLLSIFRKGCADDYPLRGFKIAVDAGNGAAGFYAERVLRPLGADVSASQFLEPDGNFPNHTPNPEDNEAMKSISSRVKEKNQDLGIIFDTDGDRAAVVFKDGREINRNRLVALAAAIALEKDPGATIVTDSVTSDGLKKFIQEKGGSHHRYMRGYKNVIDEAVRLNAAGGHAALAIETSGHAAFKENYFLDDGAYLVTKILIKAAQLKKEGKDIMSLIEGLEEPLETAEVRLNFKTKDGFKNYGEVVIEHLTRFSKENFALEPSTFEGVRTNVEFAKGWFMARMSVHDPIMPVNIESSEKGGVKMIAKVLYAYLSAFRYLDAEPLKELC